MNKEKFNNITKEFKKLKNSLQLREIEIMMEEIYNYIDDADDADDIKQLCSMLSDVEYKINIIEPYILSEEIEQ
jgi:hypothetical protein